MVSVIWMTIDRHPESLRELIREHLESTGWNIYEVSYDSIESLSNVPLEEIDAVLLAPARYFPKEYMSRLTNCRIMQIWSSGYDKFNVSDAHELGIPVANNYGSNSVSVAEHAILMMLGLSRRAPEMHNRVIDGNWSGNDHGMSSYSLNGKTLGIVGLGNIGTFVAKRAEALGMGVIFFDPLLEKSPSARWKKVDFNTLLRSSDYISFHVHLNAKTRNMINMKNLHLLSKKPFIINVSRAELVEYNALVEALGKRLIRGLGLDAHYEEPTSRNDPLLSFANVFFSPHVAGSTVDSYSTVMSRCIENISSAISGFKQDGMIAGAD